MGRRGRKRRREDAPSARQQREEFTSRYRTRSDARNEAARAALDPLEPGERPRAVTVGAIVALALGIANLAFYVAGGEIEGDRPALPGVISYSLLMLAAAWGQWRARYWAVLGMEALLGLIILVFSILLVVASNVAAALVSVAIVIPSAVLFWFLIKAMARIQMPVRE
ncbi:MAG: hypothetical protein WD844_08510 [Thermoleophilaceae bacterium]